MFLPFKSVFLTLSALVLLAGCDSKSANPSAGDSSNAVTIEFWHYFSEEQGKPLKELLTSFQKENPGFTVKPVFQGPPFQLKQKLDSSLAVTPSNNPVMSTLYESWTDDFHARKYLEPIQTFIDGPDGMSREEQDDIVRVFREGNTWDGKLVTLPFNKSIYMLYLNADKLSAAGVTTAPRTQDEFIETVKKTTTSEGDRVVTYGFGVQPRNEALTILLYARGGEYTDATGTPTIDTPEALAVLTLLRDLQYPKKQLYVNPDYMSTPFGNQQIAMYSYSSASFPYNKKLSAGKFRYKAAPIPGIEGKQPRYLMQGTNLGIFGNRPDAERAAAWKLIKYLTSSKNSAYFASRAGYMPIRYSVLKEPVMQQYMKENPDYALASELVLADKGKQEPKVAGWEGVRNDLDAMVDNLLSRPDADPKKALQEVQAKAMEKMKKK